MILPHTTKASTAHGKRMASTSTGDYGTVTADPRARAGANTMVSDYGVHRSMNSSTMTRFRQLE
jgi:hypothetical protein